MGRTLWRDVREGEVAEGGVPSSVSRLLHYMLADARSSKFRRGWAAMLHAQLSRLPSLPILCPAHEYDVVLDSCSNASAHARSARRDLNRACDVGSRMIRRGRQATQDPRIFP